MDEEGEGITGKGMQGAEARRREGGPVALRLIMKILSFSITLCILSLICFFQRYIYNQFTTIISIWIFFSAIREKNRKRKSRKKKRKEKISFLLIHFMFLLFNKCCLNRIQYSNYWKTVWLLLRLHFFFFAVIFPYPGFFLSLLLIIGYYWRRWQRLLVIVFSERQ